MTKNTDSHTLPKDFEEEFSTGFTARYVRHKARQLVVHTALKEDERPDLEQDLFLEVWSAVPSFDPDTGDWRSFVATVVERQAAQILIHRRAEKRAPEQNLDSIDVTVNDEDGNEVSLASQLLPEHQTAITGNDSPDDLELVDIRIDLETLLFGFPESDLEVLMELGEQTQEEVASLLGVTRRAVRCALERVRGRCEKKNSTISSS